ncbi:hypothetical protein Bbelb_404610 [Branchiostoma belcheri]|nr:hypothetical protein Bbelb_404610 [Branchiostoma belcheri]
MSALYRTPRKPTTTSSSLLIMPSCSKLQEVVMYTHTWLKSAQRVVGNTSALRTIQDSAEEKKETREREGKRVSPSLLIGSESMAARRCASVFWSARCPLI